MSAIFPTEPATVNIHMLPKAVDMVSYEVSDTLTLSAWMPDGFETIKQETYMSSDDFYDRHCDGCHRNCSSFLDDFRDEYGDIDYDHEDLEGHCHVFDDGYSGQHCPEGYRCERISISFDVSNMVFEVSLNHRGKPPRFNVLHDSAYLQRFELDDDFEQTRKFKSSEILMASNVFGDSYRPEGICWGYNTRPQNLREIVSGYFSTPFNNDLTNINAFEDNCKEMRHLSDYYFERNDEKVLCENAHAIMLLDAENNIQAFYTMLMAGFTPLPEAKHIMAIPLYEAEIERNGGVYRGFSTTPDAVGKSWFISPTDTDHGLLLGQL